MDFSKLGVSSVDYVAWSMEKVVFMATGQYPVVMVCGKVHDALAPFGK